MRARVYVCISLETLVFNTSSTPLIMVSEITRSLYIDRPENLTGILNEAQIYFEMATPSNLGLAVIVAEHQGRNFTKHSSYRLAELRRFTSTIYRASDSAGDQLNVIRNINIHHSR